MPVPFLQFLRAGPPPPRVALLPDALFFARTVPVAPGAPASEVGAQAGLALEGLSPFPLAQLFHGHFWVPGSGHALVYAAYRRRFTAEQTDLWADAELVLPAFASVFGLAPEPGTTVVLASEASLTAIHWEGGPVPASVVTRALPPEAAAADVARVRGEVLRLAGESLKVVDLAEAPLPEPSKSDREIAFRAGGPLSRFTAAAAAAMDVRDKDDLAALRLARARDVLLWQVTVGSLVACAALLIGELGLGAGGLWNRSRLHRYNAQEPTVDRIMRDQNLAERIDELSTKRLFPLEMISIAAQKKPATIQFMRATTSGSDIYSMRIEAQTSSAGDIGTYLSALQELPVCDKVEVHDQSSRNNVVSFTLELSFKPALLKPALPLLVMIRTLRTFFLARLFREKILIAAFALLAALIWFSNFEKRTGLFFRQAHTTGANLKEQALWLSNRDKIEAAVRAGSGRLDAALTLDGTHLLAEVTSIADDAGLKNTSTAESEDASDGHFAVHTLVFSVNRADWSSLKAFYTAIQKRSPYIGIEQFSAQADRASPALLNVSMRISSVEVIKE